MTDKVLLLPSTLAAQDSPCIPLSVSQIPFLLIHSVAAYYPDSRPPPLQPLNQGHGPRFPENTATGNG